MRKETHHPIAGCVFKPLEANLTSEKPNSIKHNIRKFGIFRPLRAVFVIMNSNNTRGNVRLEKRNKQTHKISKDTKQLQMNQDLKK